MCRLVAYSGPPLPLRRLLLDPPHNLYKQAYAPLEMTSGVLNADGYGFGWYDADNRPRIYTHTLPIWSDGNLQDLADTLSARLWLANVRSATPGQAVNLANTQPFRHGNLMYMHNGFLEDFNNGLRGRFHEHLDSALSANLQGNSDSEYLFALIRQQLLRQRQPAQAAETNISRAITTALDVLATLLDGRQAPLGLVLSDGQRLYAIRHGFGCAPPSMYACISEPDYPDAVLLASERLTPAVQWEALPPGQVWVAAPGNPLAATA